MTNFLDMQTTVKSHIKETAFKKFEPKKLKHREYKTRNTLFWVMISRQKDATHLEGLKLHLWVTYIDGFALTLKALGGI